MKIIRIRVVRRFVDAYSTPKCKVKIYLLSDAVYLLKLSIFIDDEVLLLSGKSGYPS